MLSRSSLGQRMPFDRLQRRELLTLLGGAAAAWPLAARAQQPMKPAVGVLYPGWAAVLRHLMTAFRQGLNETGFVEGQAANPATQRQHQPRAQCGLRNFAAGAARRPVR